MTTAAPKPFPPIPYGMADFSAIRREGFLYVDKTRFVRELENERRRRLGRTAQVQYLVCQRNRAALTTLDRHCD